MKKKRKKIALECFFFKKKEKPVLEGTFLKATYFPTPYVLTSFNISLLYFGGNNKPAR